MARRTPPLILSRKISRADGLAPRSWRVAPPSRPDSETARHVLGFLAASRIESQAAPRAAVAALATATGEAGTRRFRRSQSKARGNKQNFRITERSRCAFRGEAFECEPGAALETSGQNWLVRSQHEFVCGTKSRPRSPKVDPHWSEAGNALVSVATRNFTRRWRNNGVPTINFPVRLETPTRRRGLRNDLASRTITISHLYVRICADSQVIKQPHFFRICFATRRSVSSSNFIMLSRLFFSPGPVNTTLYSCVSVSRRLRQCRLGW